MWTQKLFYRIVPCEHNLGNVFISSVVLPFVSLYSWRLIVDIYLAPPFPQNKRYGPWHVSQFQLVLLNSSCLYFVLFFSIQPCHQSCCLPFSGTLQKPAAPELFFPYLHFLFQEVGKKRGRGKLWQQPPRWWVWHPVRPPIQAPGTSWAS